MPHMSPILWSMILILSITMIMLMMSMIYFNFHNESPILDKVFKDIKDQKWEW
uniref:ATP synthase F0 subunit 8 n=1 Tax=Octolasmis warwickii TaxID=479288 RepID=UPI0021CCC3D8|nr:ATP synthase F0 subunit 8 [Octolasmis warwickii]YP_010701556.1 ATP synthase F0 subunit 8 [Conchoderma hunteri]UWM12950.1 ATP synthase F0 subunit 8 [Octolasmis warwickii]WCJ53104.1 ATP synthase F0 subunit 8 [Conchoderma hunteri]